MTIVATFTAPKSNTRGTATPANRAVDTNAPGSVFGRKLSPLVLTLGLGCAGAGDLALVMVMEQVEECVDIDIEITGAARVDKLSTPPVPIG